MANTKCSVFDHLLTVRYRPFTDMTGCKATVNTHSDLDLSEQPETNKDKYTPIDSCLVPFHPLVDTPSHQRLWVEYAP